MANSPGSDNSIVEPPLRLAVDATSAARSRTGIGHYTASMLEALAKREDVELWPFTYGMRATEPLPPEVTRAAAHWGVPGKILLLGWQYLRRPRLDRLIPRAEVVFSPNYLVLPVRKPLLVAIHDLHFFGGTAQDHFSGGYLVEHLNRYLEEHASVVLTDSNAVRSQLVERFPRLEGRSEVVSPGIRERYRHRAPEAERAELSRRMGLPEQYLLCVGDWTARKNQVALLEAYRRMGEDKAPPLVLCGLSETACREVARRSNEIGLPPGLVIALPYLNDAQLHPLMSGAHGLICPSLDEGFGLVVVEALSLGVPVACSNVGSLPEVTGGLACLFDPRDPDAVGAAVAALTSDEELRSTAKERGPAWTARFSYAEAARRLTELALSVTRARSA